jgi:hypothetical protein
MTAVLAWLATSWGQAVAKWGAVAAFVAAFLWRVYAAGQKAEQSKQQEADLEALRKRNSIDDYVAKAPDGDLRDELSKWVRD